MSIRDKMRAEAGLAKIRPQPGQAKRPGPHNPRNDAPSAAELRAYPFLETVHKGPPAKRRGAPRPMMDVLRAAIAQVGFDETEIFVHAIKIMRGELTCTISGAEGPIEVGPDFKAQSTARQFLADRLWGKAVDRVEVSAQISADPKVLDPRSLSVEELAALKGALARSRALQEGDDLAPESPASGETVDAVAAPVEPPATS